MTDQATARAARVEPASEISPAAYAAFIGQIQLVAVWLHDARVVNHYGPSSPDRAEIDVQSRAWWEGGEGVEPRFQAFHAYTIRIATPDDPLAEIDVTFGLRFTSKEPMTDAIFRLFESVNLPVNTWPYLREYVATTAGRMNWLPLTLPALKRGTPPNRPGARRASSKSTVSQRKAG